MSISHPPPTDFVPEGDEASPMLAAALQLAAEEFAVVPVTDKRPLNPGGFNNASTDTETIRAWWTRWPDAGVGIGTEPSGLLIVDVDQPAGPDALHALEAKHADLPDTLTVTTPSGGRHLYFNAPAGVTLAQSIGKIGTNIDIRAGGAMVVAPPTDGYHVDDADHELPRRALIADAPPWLVGLCRKDRADATGVSQGIQGQSLSFPVFPCDKAGTPLPVTGLPVTPEQWVDWTLPDAEKQRNGRLLDLVRALKLNCGLALEDCEPHARAWWDKARAAVPIDASWYENWKDFRYAYDRAWLPIGADPATAAMAQADSKPRPPEAHKAGEDDMARLIAFAVERQRMAGEGEAWPLSVSVAARLLWGETGDEKAWQTRRRSAHRKIKALEATGLLKCTKRGKPAPPDSPSPASRYVWQGTP